MTENLPNIDRNCSSSQLCSDQEEGNCSNQSDQKQNEELQDSSESNFENRNDLDNQEQVQQNQPNKINTKDEECTQSSNISQNKKIKQQIKGKNIQTNFSNPLVEQNKTNIQQGNIKNQINSTKQQENVKLKEGLFKQNTQQNTKQTKQVNQLSEITYDSQKYQFGIDDNPALEKERKNLWKVFGRECDVGKQLFSLYKCNQAPQIQYPKIKQKQKDEAVIPKQPKVCPQKTIIEYPPLSYKEIKQKYYKVDFIPKRKPESQIRKEIENYYSIPFVPVNTGKNRAELILNLQQKFKYLRGGLPKCAELPMIDEKEMVFNQQLISTQAQKKIGQSYFQTNNQKLQEDQVKEEKRSPIEECNVLFDEIIQEIEERQQYLDSIENLKEPELKNKIKQEIIERVSELQKLTELKKKYT